MLSRHGVRAPTASPQALAAATGRPWPSFPVAPGELTPHGAEALAAMGAYLRQVYVRDGVLPAGRCPAKDAVQVWADGGDHRTRQSGQILADQLAPGCGLLAAHGLVDTPDPLFDASSTGVCPMRPQDALEAVQARLDSGAALVDAPAARAITALKALLGPDACRAASAACLEGPTTLMSGKGAPKLMGPLATAASAGENLLLEYAQGLAPDEVGWGAGSATVIAEIVQAHERSADLLRKTPYIAAHNGAVMARTIMDLLQGRAPSDPHAPPIKAGAQVVMIAGHDTNLSNIAGVLGLTWALPDEPDSTAPDTTLALELWRDPHTGGASVRAVVYSQSLEQLRSASRLDAAHPPGVTPVTIGVCAPDGAASCTLEALTSAVRARLPPECLMN